MTADTALISVGDFTHKCDRLAALQYKAVGYLYPRVAKLRMYGAASIDCALFASGRLAATVFTTHNLWDIAPGILLSQEAGALFLVWTENPMISPRRALCWLPMKRSPH